MSDNTEPLDIDAWIAGAKLPEVEVTLTQRGDSLALRNDLVEKRGRDLRARRAAVEPGRMVSADTSHELDEQIAELEAEVKASEITLRFRGITGDEHAAVLAERKKDGDQAVLEAIVAVAAVSPKLTPDQVHRLRQAVGEGQWRVLWAEVSGASFDTPDLDF